MKVRVAEYTRDSAARDAIQDGDLVMFRGGPLHDRVIEIGTSGIYCHSALAYTETDASGEKRMYLVQATKQHGVSTALISDEVAGFQGAMEHWRIKLPHLKKYLGKKATDLAKTKLGLPYAMTPIYWFALDFITFRLFDLRQRKIDPNAWFCSELVAWAAREGGMVDLDTKHVDAATAPSDLVTHGRAECIGAFAHPAVVAKAKG